MERKMRYETPNMTIDTLLNDVIRTSSLTDGGSGSGGTITYPTNATTIEEL